MIPYFEPPKLAIGPVELHLFGILWLLGWLVGNGVVLIRADDEHRRAGFALGSVAIGVPAALIVSWLGALIPTWVADGAAPDLASAQSVPRFLATVVPFAVVWHGATDPGRLWASLDAFALGMTALWGVGRVGSFLMHDDLGGATLFPLAVQGICPDYPHSPVIACHDLGLYDVLACGAWMVALAQLRRRGAGPGIAAGATLAAFGGWRVLTGLLRPGWPFTGGWFDPTLIVLGVVALAAAASAREPR